MSYKCIYSLKDDSNATFNTSEHIFPKFLGGIHTLDKGLVCDEVNQMFSSYEMSFARNNPLVAISRMLYGPSGRPKPQAFSLMNTAAPSRFSLTTRI